ncbi:MAG TPA: response regulator [Candidatus Hodarchaeales archaeon]|nr:response regulator [Candidatus Hodarchaeales archaeon]
MHTILFVDDEPIQSEGLRMILEAKGFRCVSLTNMTEALHFLETNEVSVLVSDIMMPAGDDYPEIDSSETGFHFVANVRKKFPDVAIICLSVIGDQAKIRTLKRQGVLYLRKGETPLDTAAGLIESKATGVSRF